MNKHYTFQEYIENFSSIQDSYDYYFEQQKEIDRLNNIINEIREQCKSVIGNPEYTIVSKNELCKQFLETIEKN